MDTMQLDIWRLEYYDAKNKRWRYRLYLTEREARKQLDYWRSRGCDVNLWSCKGAEFTCEVCG